MRTLKKNKRKMYYSLYNKGMSKIIYEKDEYGNIKYMDIEIDDGEIVTVPIESGTMTVDYELPVEFKANIYSDISEAHMKAYGVDKSSIYSELVVSKGALPLNYGSIIWKESKIVYEDDVEDVPKQSSSDYTVVGVMKEALHEDYYLLQHNSREDSQ